MNALRPSDESSTSNRSAAAESELNSTSCADSDLSLVRIAQAFEGVETQLRRIADHFDPPPPDKVDTTYVAKRLGCTTTWIAELVRNGDISKGCIVPGTGNGKPWKFFRTRIDRWIETR